LKEFEQSFRVCFLKAEPLCRLRSLPFFRQIQCSPTL
jgi:hypothetical protein